MQLLMANKILPKVTIAIPTYNRGLYISQAIESALAQDYPNLEVIVSDNASNDNTLELVQKYRLDERFIFYRKQSNVGSQKNWEKLLYEYATGEWILFLGSDDYIIDKSFISKAIDLTTKSSNCVFCFSNIRLAYEADKRFVDRAIMDLPGLTQGTWYFWEYKKSSMIHIVGMLFNRNKAIEVEAFKLDAIGGEIELISKLLLLGDVGFINTIAVAYRIHDNGDSYTASFDRLYRHYQCYKNVFEFGVNLHPDLHSKLVKWKKERIQGFFKTAFYNFLTENKYLAFKFLLRSSKDYPKEILPLFLQIKLLIAILIGFFFSERTFRKVRDMFFLKFYNKTAEPYA